MLDIAALMDEPPYVPVPSGDTSPSKVFIASDYLKENAKRVREGNVHVIWRFCIMQALDIYEAEKAHHSLEKAKSIFAKPIVDEVSEDTKYLDAGFTALAWYLSNKDNWVSYFWMEQKGKAENVFWVVPSTRYGKYQAEEAPVPEFKEYGVLVHVDDLRRA
ncbi:MAG: hypothetical protein QM571_00025 [Micrococcaceae bacterium]